MVVRYDGPQVLFGGAASTMIDGDTVHQFTSSATNTLDLHAATIAGDISGSTLTWTAIPEPTTALAGLLRRRRASSHSRSLVRS